MACRSGVYFIFYIACPPPSSPPSSTNIETSFLIFLVSWFYNQKKAVTFYCRAKSCKRKDIGKMLYWLWLLGSIKEYNTGLRKQKNVGNIKSLLPCREEGRGGQEVLTDPPWPGWMLIAIWCWEGPGETREGRGGGWFCLSQSPSQS